VQLATHSGRGGDVDVRYEGPDEGVVVAADAAQLRQLTWNLVRNAVQASTAGAEVVVRVSSVDGSPALEVQDDGPGIGEDAKDLIFNAFFTTRSSGVGIGLAVVKQVADDHGFAVQVESERGRGALFRVVMLARKRPGVSSIPPLPR
jgi:signal transduction histidine kinase